ncbi:GntR family transcriptional regulator [Salmonella enterica]|nr:helix-turn-helix domain-containing protein [Salmonella enterica]EAX3608014.1 GntR family transcriptional regulator [Salmonella enterica]EGW6281694.1 GntR family transcriptional regulator [Salmonella enterica]EGX3935212.1 GntR family transcriptional regulator [Salmonella enterica]
MSSRILGNVWDACAAHNIKGAKLLIMARLADYSNDDGMSYPSVETICRQLGLGESTVRSAISELESAGWLSREFRRRGNRNSSNKYYLNAERLEMYARTEKDKVKALKEEQRNRDSFHPPESEGSESDPLKSEGSNDFHPPESGKNGVFTLQNLDPDPQVNSKHDPQVNSKHESQDIGASADAPAPARSAKQDYSPEFETAWQAYPKRAGGNSKSAAWKHWKARLKDGVKPEDMLAGVKRYAAYCQTTGNTGTQYVKQASTFFGPDRHFEESWQISAVPVPRGVRNTISRLSGLGRMSDEFGESSDNLTF